MTKWWDMSITELAREAETGLRTLDIRPDVAKGVLELLHATQSTGRTATVFSAATRSFRS